MDPMYPEDNVLHTGSRGDRARLLGFAALMLIAAVVGGRYAAAAERRSLESVAQPLAYVE